MRKPRLAQAARALLVAGLLAVCHGATPPLGQIDKIRCALYEAIDGSTIPGVEQPLLAQVMPSAPSAGVQRSTFWGAAQIKQTPPAA